MPSNSVQNPLFRKAILPWYDTYVACIVTSVFMAIVFAFSVAGVAVAFETLESRSHVWVPCILVVLSALVVASILFRLFRRRAR